MTNVTVKALPLRLIAHLIFAALTLVVVHYLLVLQTTTPAHYATFAYSIVAFAYGYDLRFRLRLGSLWVPIIALTVGILAAVAMSSVVAIMFDQPFFPDQRQMLDFVETCVLIALSYWAGYTLAVYVAHVISAAPDRTAIGSIREVVSRTSKRPGLPITKTIRSVDGLLKALTALGLTLATLIIVVKKILAW